MSMRPRSAVSCSVAAGLAGADLEGIVEHGVLALGRQRCQCEDDEQIVRLQTCSRYANCEVAGAGKQHRTRPSASPDHASLCVPWL